MRAQLYLHKHLRKDFQKSIELFSDIYADKMTPVFENIEEEADTKAEEKYEELGKYFNPDYHDPGDFAEYAWEAGLEYYEGMALMKYNTKLMWISTLYQFWEQQVRKFIYEEVTRTHRFIDKKGNEVPFRGFCTKGIDDIKEELNAFGQDIEKLECWPRINELRLLTNVIKHGDGWSATQLKQLRPDFFESEFLKGDMLELYKTTLNEVVLNIDNKEIEIYCKALIDFWGALPERMYSKD